MSSKKRTPEERKIADETHIAVRCMTEEVEPDLCGGWCESVDLDAPAYIDHNCVIAFDGDGEVLEE